jgi:coenzyme F420-reducing hydrogenase beta subunit
MKVSVKTDGKRFFIPLPFGIIKFGILMAKSPLVLKHTPEKYRVYINCIDTNELSKCIGILKQYKGLRIVDVRDKDGTEVVITI